MNKFAVAQLGARMHYAVPRIFHKANILGKLFTDICGTKGFPRLFSLLPEKLTPSSIKRLVGRNTFEIPADKIVSFNKFGISLNLKRKKMLNRLQKDKIYLWAGSEFCNQVINYGLSDIQGVYTFNGAALELLKYSKSRGIKSICEQTMAPYEIEDSLLLEEEKKYSSWKTDNYSRLNQFRRRIYDREREEWKWADVIVCASEFVKNGIILCGGQEEKIVVVPYGVDTTSTKKENYYNGSRKLRILFVGSVGLRKGIPYLIDAAQEIKKEVEFKIIGPIEVGIRTPSELSNVEFVGSVPRQEIARYFAWADVFLFPSLCEGSATVCYEAMSYSLPIITTLNSGSVVRDGIDGFIINPQDPRAIIDSIGKFIDSPQLVSIFGNSAFKLSKSYSLNRYADRLLKVVNKLDYN